MSARRLFVEGPRDTYVAQRISSIHAICTDCETGFLSPTLAADAVPPGGSRWFAYTLSLDEALRWCDAHVRNVHEVLDALKIKEAAVEVKRGHHWF